MALPKFQNDKSTVEQYATKHRLESEGLSQINMGELLDSLEKASPERRKELLKIIGEGLKETHLKMLGLAIDDGFITQQEIDDWKKKYEADEIEISQLIRPYYEQGIKVRSNKKYEHRVFMVTDKKAPLMRMKKMASKRFNISIITVQEANKKLLAEKKNEEAQQ